MLRSWLGSLFRMVWPWGFVFFGGVCVLVGLLLAVNAVDTSITADDRAVIKELGVDHICDHVDSYDAELACIFAIQASIFHSYPSTRDAFHKGVSSHGIADYDARGYGSCYDRATLIEQSLRHYGFRARRVALFEAQNSPFLYLMPEIRSHALSEVETSRGWLAIDSIAPFIAVDRDLRPHTIGQIQQGLRAGVVDDRSFSSGIPDDFFDGEFIYVYGLYSRHGYFFEPHLPVPEIDWSNFGY